MLVTNHRLGYTALADIIWKEMSNSCRRLCLKPSAVGITCYSPMKCLRRMVKGQDQDIELETCRLL